MARWTWRASRQEVRYRSSLAKWYRYRQSLVHCAAAWMAGTAKAEWTREQGRPALAKRGSWERDSTSAAEPLKASLSPRSHPPLSHRFTSALIRSRPLSTSPLPVTRRRLHWRRSLHCPSPARCFDDALRSCQHRMGAPAIPSTAHPTLTCSASEVPLGRPPPSLPTGSCLHLIALPCTCRLPCVSPDVLPHASSLFASRGLHALHRWRSAGDGLGPDWGDLGAALSLVRRRRPAARCSAVRYGDVH